MKEIVWARVCTQFDAQHRYPEATGEVGFLAGSHQHTFKVEVFVEQFHDNRDVEYLGLKRYLDKLLADMYHSKDLGSTSCETLARTILSWVKFHCGEERQYQVLVTEDGAHGALLQELAD